MASKTQSPSKPDARKFSVTHMPDKESAPTSTTDRALLMCPRRSTRSSTLQRRRRTYKRGQLQSTRRHDEADHDVGTRQRHQPTHRGKAADTRGVNAEMIKHSTGRLNKHVPPQYIKAIKHHEQPPTWRDTTIKVIYKSGDPSLPSFYRPMCWIPILYKLLSSSSSSDYNPRETPTSPLTKQVSDQAAPRQTTY